tara:strand:+ start:186 stop:542 length:357 start_codon:yes stop_codon:yes gene_type:complete
MHESLSTKKSPLTLQELALIEATKLSILDRHYLRLLAHCLACFKEIAKGSMRGPLPSKDQLMQWFSTHPSLSSDEGFIELLLEQFQATAIYLEKLAVDKGITPLELTLSDLINSFTLP